ncbi:hypothetical protein Bca4012_030450 [Brassica carinata]|uniref:Uncharacterized protein n=3 Tax=Brassica TaxID=3705 RepID=A0A8X7RKK8_BRACI|nr:hypothetical protein Bca52824_048252 [Brassica carinata]KAH0883855.1 hypothetical protein HID58_059951 [Brassica napus]CAF1834812.1 unnamed protein product [Brassica napus]VDD08450.1 unnamed protein product [Brassica oleracea]
MVNSFMLLADFKSGRCSKAVEVRLLRFWKARNVKKDDELMSVDMLLVDEKEERASPIAPDLRAFEEITPKTYVLELLSLLLCDDYTI